jgi:hypothetical protein
MVLRGQGNYLKKWLAKHSAPMDRQKAWRSLTFTADLHFDSWEIDHAQDENH